MKIAFIIVAGGSGTRIGAQVPKQFLEITTLHHPQKLPIVLHTILALHDICQELGYQEKFVVVLHKDFVDYFQQLVSTHQLAGVDYVVTHGGENRFDSVKNGLRALGENFHDSVRNGLCALGENSQTNESQALEQKSRTNESQSLSGNSGNPSIDLIAVHDAVRPYVTKELVQRAVELALDKGSAVPAIDLTDSIRIIDAASQKGEHPHSRPLERSLCRLVQTPQVFRSELLIDAYRQPYNESFTDDASVVESYGGEIFLSQGDIANIKITYPKDIL